MAFQIFLALLVPLAVIAVVGYLIWIGVRSLVRGLASLLGNHYQRPLPVELCPRCGELVTREQGVRRCVLCNWSTDGRSGNGHPGVNRILTQLCRRVERYQEAGLITSRLRDRLVEVIQAESPPLPAAAPAPAGAERPAAAAPFLKPEKPAPASMPEPGIEFLGLPAVGHAARAPEPATVHQVVESVAARARDFQTARAQRGDEPIPERSVARDGGIQRPEPTPKQPAQPLTKLLSAFLEEKNIRWGEVVGGLLIVGCSLALVISFWASIAERPWLKFGLFNGVTAVLFAVGFHAERRWRLPTTARGLLVIATLLTPLNLLAVASLTRVTVGESPSTWLGEAAAIGLFAALCYGAGRDLVGRAPWTVAVGVVVPSAAMFLIRRLAGPDSGTGNLLALGALPLVAQAVAVGGLLGKIRRMPEVDEPVAHDLLRGLGLSSFATVLALGLLVARSGPTELVLHRLSPLLPLAGAPALATGLWLWRRTTAQTLAGYRTAGTSIAAAGILVSLSAIAVPWPDPAGILLGAGLNAAMLAAIAVGFEIPVAHALAGLCLALVYVLGWLVLSGRLGWSVATSSETGAALLSQFSGLILVPLVLLWLVVTAVALRRGRPLDAQAYAVVAGLVTAVSLGLVGWHGFGRAGDPSGATWVFAAYAVIALGSAAGFGRWPLFAATQGLPELRALTWLGSGLIFAALVQGLVFGARDGWGLPVPWLDVLLAHATLSLGVALLLSMLARARSVTANAARDILSQPVVPTAVVASAGLLWLLPTAPLGSLSGHFLWLAPIWLVLAWRQNSPTQFAAFQAALSGAVVCGVGVGLKGQAWFRGGLSWLDPWSLQSLGISLSCLGLVWIALRLEVQRWPAVSDPAGAVAAARLGRLLNPRWPAFDRLIQAALMVALSFLAVYAVVPGAAQELTPRSLAAQLSDSAVSSWARVVPPAIIFEIPGVPHSHALGAGSWLLLGLILTMILASQWHLVRRFDLVGALVVGALSVPLLAGRWEAHVAVASALRWASAGYLLGASLLVWNRDRLSRVARRLGWPLVPERVAGLDELATVVVLSLGMVPLLVMALYTGMAALAARPPDAGLTRLWIWVGLLFVVLATVGIGLRRIGDPLAADSQPAAGARSWMRPASLLLLLLGLFPLLAVTGFAVSSALAGNPVVGPEPGTLLARAGNARSYVPPVLLMAVTLLGYAIRERSSGFAFAAALVLNVAATIGYLMAGVRGRLSFDADLWVRLSQLNAVVAAAYAMAWLGVLAGWSRRAGRPGLVAVPGVLSTLIALGVVLNLLVLGAGTVALWFEPAPVPAVQAMATPLGWIGFGLAVAAVVLHARLTGRRVVPGWLGMGLVSAAAMLAIGLAGRDIGDWRAYHEMLANQAVAGLLLLLVGWNQAGLSPAALPTTVRRSVAGWSTLALGIVVLYAVREYGSSAPQSPWWTLGGLAAAVLLSVGLAGWTARQGYLVLAAVLLNLAMTLGWCASTWWKSSLRFGSPPVDLLNVNVLGLVLPAPLWLWLGRRITRLAWPGRLNLQERSAALLPVSLQRTVSWLALAGLGLGVLIALLVEVRSGNSPYPLLGWLAVVATAVAFAVGLWDQASRGTLCGLYLLGLCAAGWALVPLRLTGAMLLWLGTVVLAAYAVLTSYLWSRRALFRRLADRLGIVVRAGVDAEASPSRLIAANLAVVVVVAVLSFGAILTDPDVIRRSSAADAVLASALAIGLLAWGRRRSLLQGVALSVGVLGAIAWGWAWLEPSAITVRLDRLVVVFAALVGSTVFYGLGLAKLLPRVPEWTRAAQRLVPGLLVLSPLALIMVLGAELAAVSENRAAAMSGWAVIIVAATFLTAAVAALVAALVPGRDPLGLTEPGRTAYVYGAEVLLAVLILHLRLTMPWLFGGVFARFWPLILLGVAFLGVGLSELFRRQGRRVLAEPLERTGVLLPVLPLATGLLWSTPQPGEDVVFLVLVGGLYTLLSVLRSSLVFGALAGLAFNGVLWTLLSHAEGLGLLRHPQLWIIPPAMCVFVGAYWNRDRLSAAQLAAIRYGAAIVIYVSSLADFVLTGVAQAPWLPLVLALLGIAGILAGIWLRVRGFLFLGLGAVCLAVFTIIWYAAVDLHQSWLWWASGIAAGMLILILFGLFEKKRQEILRVVDQLRAWNP